MGQPGNHARCVYALGEALLDLIHDGDRHLQIVPGGSVLNAAVSLARTGVATSLLSEYGQDAAGHELAKFLSANGVSTACCTVSADRKTSIALAFLDHEKKAGYSFYHDFPDEIHFPGLPAFGADDILLFGSFYSVRKNREKLVSEITEKARNASSLIIYDPNIRKNHFNGTKTMLQAIKRNMARASIIKGSDEDFALIFGTTDQSTIYSKVSKFCKYLIITAGPRPIRLFTPTLTMEYEVPVFEPVSTIGAGDNFNAGLIFGLINENVRSETLESISPDSWERIIKIAVEFASQVCLSAENYINNEFASGLRSRYSNK